jgi:O-antigen/teichoic acid export membrane protein
MAEATNIGAIIRELSRDIWRILSHRMVGDAGWLAASQYASTGLGLITTIVAARLLGPAEYGMAAMILTYPIFLWSFMSLKSASVTTRYISSFHTIGRNEDLKSICKLGYILDLLIAVVTFVLVSATSQWVAHHIYNNPQMGWLMVLYAASIPFLSFSGTSRALLSSLQRFRWLSGLYILNDGIRCIVMLGFLLGGFGASAIVLAIVVENVIGGLTMLSAATYVLHRDGIGLWWNVSLSNVVPLRKELLNFYKWNYLIVTLIGAMAQVPVMLLGHFRSPQEAGFYKLTMSLATAESYLETSMGQVVYPILSSRWTGGERENLSRTLQRWTMLAGLPTGALVVLSIPLLPIAIPMVFGRAFSPMVPGAQMMMVGIAVSGVFFWLSSFYYASGRIDLWTKGYGIQTVLAIGLAWFCIQQWGFFGLAALVTVAKVLFLLVMVLIASSLTMKHINDSEGVVSGPAEIS